MVELEENLKASQKQGLGVLAVSYDSVAVLRNFAERKGIHFPLLSDADSKIIGELGIRNETVPRNTPFYGIPHPGTFIVDRNRKVVSKYFEEDFKERYTSADILVHQFEYTPAAARSVVQRKQLTVEASASNSTVRSGERIALVLDLQLKPKMHVYAPGVQGYIPIAWKMKDSEAWKSHDADFPPSEKLHLAAIDETVPVYQNRIRLTRDVTAGSDSALKAALDGNGKLMVEGTLRYQACDDRMCFIPETLPLKWTFEVEQHDRTRAPAGLQRRGP